MGQTKAPHVVLEHRRRLVHVAIPRSRNDDSEIQTLRTPLTEPHVLHIQEDGLSTASKFQSAHPGEDHNTIGKLQTKRKSFLKPRNIISDNHERSKWLG